MFKRTIQRVKRRLSGRDANEHENGYWRELTEGEIQQGHHRDFVGGMWEEIGQLQLDFLVGQGLRPEHMLLDVGCGALRGGVHFVRYLDPGHYFGIDRNRSLIEAGRRELAAGGLGNRRVNLHVSSAFDVSFFGIRFDYAIAVSLFTHLYGNHLVRCLHEVARVLNGGGRFYASFFQAPRAAHVSEIVHMPCGVTTHLDSDPFHYSVEEISAYADSAGLRTHYIGDWGHPRGQKMLYFTPPP